MALTLLSLKDRSFTFFNFLRGIDEANSGHFLKKSKNSKCPFTFNALYVIL